MWQIPFSVVPFAPLLFRRSQRPALQPTTRQELKDLHERAQAFSDAQDKYQTALKLLEDTFTPDQQEKYLAAKVAANQLSFCHARFEYAASSQPAPL